MFLKHFQVTAQKTHGPAHSAILNMEAYVRTEYVYTNWDHAIFHNSLCLEFP